MNKFIKEQLNKCSTILPFWDENTTQLIITGKQIPNKIQSSSGNITIQIENYIINEPSNFTLSSNWNGGSTPPEHMMNVKIIQQMGKMYKVSGEGVSTKEHWEGWLPQKGFKVIENK